MDGTIRCFGADRFHLRLSHLIRDMYSSNRKQLIDYEVRLLALWKTNSILIETLKAIQGSLSPDDVQQRAILNRIELALEQI
ncbi:hypothetical protein GCT13_12015 [Paraburkholderia sp. CNPSo 3157]|uniref:Uncharacterized protein n=1 Tax=Paraburkholderia franconis TaxID=2654983 RepID=A0A7X1N987_9BURK|nr:hypothetical protein [Paraburkholderia franconis]MPW17635.1 hypothetical protein [Paraburkholderia franconis]